MSRNEFHNGRSYAADLPEGAGGMFGWLKALAHRLLGKAVEPTDIPPIAHSKINSPFSLLGTSEQNIEPHRSGRPVFPMTDWATRSPAPPHRRRTGRSVPATSGLTDQDR
jgi:hypothetical protein